MLRNDNYVVIPAWAVNELHLAKTDLVVYSIINGFCQDGDSCYNGSIDYLCEWTGCTRQGITKVLNNLIEGGFITKTKAFPNNIYRVVRNANVKPIEIKPEVNQSKFEKDLADQAVVEEIMTFFNLTCNTHYKASTNSNKKYVKALLKQGFTVDDMKEVILAKYAEWGMTPKRFSNGQMSDTYVRPSTILGPKFCEYLEQARKTSEGPVVKSVAPLAQRSTMSF